MEQFLIVCPLVFLAGFVDSIAGGRGIDLIPGVYAGRGSRPCDPGNLKAERLSGPTLQP